MWKPSYQELLDFIRVGGSDFYVVHAEQFNDNCDLFYRAFASRYPSVRMGYSVKTNYLPYFLNKTHEKGWYTEVVSGFEYQLARELNIDGDNIIFNGPVKFEDEILTALTDGAMVNIDSLDELNNVSKLTRRINKKYKSDKIFEITLRLNFYSQTGIQSRFGIDSMDDFDEANKIISSSPYLKLSGLHLHYCFSKKEPKSYRLLSETFTHWIKDKAFLPELKTINFGGGFFSSMPSEMADNWGGEIPTFDDYAEAITKPLLDLFTDKKTPAPELILEPGLAVVANAVSYVSSVHAIKQASNQQIAILSGSIYNIKPTKSKLNIPFTKLSKTKQERAFTGNITGYTCMEDDVVYTNYDGSLNVGDHLIFCNAGAYTTVLKPPFIRLAPAILLDTKEITNIPILAEQQKIDTFFERQNYS